MVRSAPPPPASVGPPQGPPLRESVSPYFATAAKGTEGLLRDELRSLGIPQVRGDRGGVHFGGSLLDAFRVCLYSRIAVRVLEHRATVPARSEGELYDELRALDLSDVLEPSRTFAVSATLRSSALTHSQFVSRRIKDAVVDSQRERHGRRSDVDAHDPDVQLQAHLVKDELTLYVDLSGVPLHRRGYRPESAPAPLKETLAAALLRLGRYDGTEPFFDPLCGSGTLAVEAALIAHNRAPGSLRTGFGLERFARVSPGDRRSFQLLREQARAEERVPSAPIVGADIELDALELTRTSARRAGVEVTLARRDVLRTDPPELPGLVVTNPPYGVRMDGGVDFEQRLGEKLATYQGQRVLVITATPQILQGFGRAPDLEHQLFNGDIDCRAFGWNLAAT